MEYRKFMSDVGLVGVVRLLVTLRGFLLLPLITKLLGEESYGIWILITVTLTLMSYLFTFGLPYSLVRFLSGRKSKRWQSELFISSAALILVASLLVAAFLYIFSSTISALLFSGRADLVRLMAVTFPFFALNLLFVNFFRARRNMKLYAFGVLFQNYGLVLLVYYLILQGHGLYEAVISILVTNIILALALSLLILRSIGVGRPSLRRIRRMLDFGIPTIPTNFASWITNSSDRYLIVFYLGVAAVGTYSPAYMFGFTLSILSSPLAFVLPSVISDLYDRSRKKEVRRYLTFSARVFTFISIPAFFGMALFSWEFLNILSTENIANEGQLIVPLVGASALLWSVVAIYSQTIVLAKRTKLIGGIALAVAIINLGLNLMLIPLFGIIGAAVSTVLAFTVWAIVVIRFSRRFLRFRFDYSFFLKSLASSLIMFGILFFFKIQTHTSILFMSFLIALGILIYTGLMFLLGAKPFVLLKQMFGMLGLEKSREP